MLECQKQADKSFGTVAERLWLCEVTGSNWRHRFMLLRMKIHWRVEGEKKSQRKFAKPKLIISSSSSMIIIMFK